MPAVVPEDLASKSYPRSNGCSTEVRCPHDVEAQIPPLAGGYFSFSRSLNSNSFNRALED